MFTGIIQSVGTIRAISHAKTMRVVIAPHLKKRFSIGESVSIDGVCSTIIAIKNGDLVFEYMPHTLKKTTIPHWTKGRHVNIEPSLKAGDELSGHFVLGHVDQYTDIVKVEKQNGQGALTVQVPKNLIPYVSLQGSIALDGVSLTIGNLTKKSATVFLTPFTYSHTTFQYKKAGDLVNLEVDMLAKLTHDAVCQIKLKKKSKK